MGSMIAELPVARGVSATRRTRGFGRTGVRDTFVLHRRRNGSVVHRSGAAGRDCRRPRLASVLQARQPTAERGHRSDGWTDMGVAAGNKDKALDAALANIEKQFGKGSVMRLGDEVRAPLEVIPTGSIALDVALGLGGLPRGRVVEIYGPESSGKT